MEYGWCLVGGERVMEEVWGLVETVALASEISPSYHLAHCHLRQTDRQTDGRAVVSPGVPSSMVISGRVCGRVAGLIRDARPHRTLTSN